MPRGGSRAAAMGRAGTLRSLSQAIRDRRARKKDEAAAEEAEKISSIRIPIGAAQQPKAMEQPISMEDQPLESPTGEPITPPMDIAGEQAAAQDQYEETNRAIEETKDLEVRNVEELPMMKQLEPYPSAKNRVMQLAEANGWVKMIGGVPTISNKQMQLAQGIIGGDLKLRKELNELSLNDITQEVMGLKQSMLDPKMKDEDKAQAQAQLDDAMGRQNSILNAVNMMDRKIQEGLALRKPSAAPEVDTTNLMYQDAEGNYRWGLHDESGNLIKDLRAATGKEIKDKDAKGLDVGKYRSYLKDATSNAYKELFANDETMMQEIAQLDADISEEEKAKIEAKIHRDLSPTQRTRLSELKEKWFKDEAPESIWKQYRKIKGAKRKGTKAVTDPLGLR